MLTFPCSCGDCAALYFLLLTAQNLVECGDLFPTCTFPFCFLWWCFRRVSFNGRFSCIIQDVKHCFNVDVFNIYCIVNEDEFCYAYLSRFWSIHRYWLFWTGETTSNCPVGRKGGCVTYPKRLVNTSSCTHTYMDLLQQPFLRMYLILI